MSGRKGRSGRKKNPRNALRYFNEIYDLNSYELAEVTIQKALDGDKELLMYCHDRRLGKPKASDTLTIEGGQEIGKDMFLSLLKEYERINQAFLEGKTTLGEYNAIEQGTQQGEDAPI